MANDNNNYTLPFGIDPREFLAGVDVIEKAADDMSKNVTDAQKEVQQGFGKTVAAEEQFEAAMASAVEKTKAVREAAKAMGKDIGDALSVKGSKNFEAEIDKFRKALATAGKGGKIQLDIDFNETVIQELQKGLEGASDEMEHFKTLVEAAKVQLASLDPQSADFASLSQQIATTEGFIEGLSAAAAGAKPDVDGLGQAGQDAADGLDDLDDSLDKPEKKAKSLKAQLRALKEELSAMEEAGLENTKRFEELSIQAGALEDQIGDTSARVRVLASDTKYIDATIEGVTGLVGAMTAAQGASALFGDENKDLQESIAKVTAAMAILQGIQAVANVLNKDSAFSILLLSRARQADTVAAEIETAAVVAEAGATEAATVATTSFTAALLANPITLILVAIVAAVAAIYQFTKSSDDAEAATRRLNRALEDQKTILDLDVAALKRRTDLLAAQAGLVANNEEEVIRIQGRALQAEFKLQADANAMNRQRLNDLDDTMKKEGDYNEERVKTREALNASIIEGEQKTADLGNQIQLKGIELQKQRLSDQRAIRDEVLKLTKEVIDAEISGRDPQSIAARARAERDQVRADANQRIKELQNEIHRSAEAEKLRDQLITNIRRETAAKLKAIDRKAAEERQALELSAAKTVLDLAKEGQQDAVSIREGEARALAIEEAERKAEILERYRGEKALQDNLLVALESYIADKRKNLRLKYAQEDIDTQQRIAEASVTILYGASELPRRLEEAKQMDLLRIQLTGAEKRLQALRDAGKKETDEAVIIARAEIIKVQAEINAAAASGKRYDNIFDVLGLTGEGGLTPGQIKGINEGSAAIVGALKQITDASVSNAQLQVDASTKKIQAIQTEIDKLQGQYEKEAELQKKGYANNAEYLKKQLDAKNKAAKDEEATREEALEKQKRAQRLQLIIDSVAQGSALVTASANVIAGFSTIPIVGVPLGIAAVGVMIAGFIASKIAALKQINKQSFRGGGTVDGPSHENDGVKYVSADGRGVVELEGGEEVIRKEVAARRRQLLKKINAGASDEDLLELFRGTGVYFQTDTAEKGNKAHDDFAQATSAHFVRTGGNSESSEDLKAIRKDVGFLADKKRREVETWEEGGFTVKKTGQKIEKIKKS